MKLKITKSYDSECIEDKLYGIAESHSTDFTILEIGEECIVECGDYGWTLLKMSFDNLEIVKE